MVRFNLIGSWSRTKGSAYCGGGSRRHCSAKLGRQRITPPASGRKERGNEDTRNRRGRVHRLPPVSPIACRRTRRLGRGQRIQRPARERAGGRLVCIVSDVTRPAEVEPIFARGLDAVCHIAGQVSIIRSFSDPVADLRTNVEGTLNILQLCLRYKVPRLLYASSMTVYGDCRNVPTPETEPCRPDSYYGITKHAAERYVHATAERPDLGFDFRVTSLRMFSVYGPGQASTIPYQGVLGIFSGNLLRGEPITIFGDGEQTRDFVYIDDIVDGWVRALDNPASGGGVFNLGSGRSLSINQLAERAVAAFGHPPGGYKVIRAPARPGEQRTVQRRHSPGAVGPRLGAADDFRKRAGADGPLGSGRVRRPADGRSGERCAMKLLLVTSVDPWTRSVSTVHKYVAAGRALGHEVAVYGNAACGVAHAAVHHRPGRGGPRPVRHPGAVGFSGHAIPCAGARRHSPRAAGGGGPLGPASTTRSGWSMTSTTWRSSTAIWAGNGRTPFGRSRTRSCSRRLLRSARTCGRSCSTATMPVRSQSLTRPPARPRLRGARPRRRRSPMA